MIASVQNGTQPCGGEELILYKLGGDILMQATYNYKVVRQFTVMTVVWGIVGMLVGAYIAAELIWPQLNVVEWL
ncbi:MAG TPA: hypothetical protein VMV91_09585, partial [Rhodocyclaceae bacterium]|nr:hypothetical protein [Rhodocyclaceae bacterium]